MTAAIAKTTDVQSPSSQGAQVMSMIERVASDKNIPVERLEQMFELYQKVEVDNARKAFFSAFAEMQPKLPIVEKKGRGHNSKYAKWEDICDLITPVIAEYGFALSFRTKRVDGDQIVSCVLSHKDGHAEETELVLPADNSGGKNAIQAHGSTIQYGKRYTACAILNVVTKDEDDDGNAAGGVISDEQAQELMQIINDTKANIGSFLKLARAQSIPDIRAADFATLKQFLLMKKQNQEAKNNE